MPVAEGPRGFSESVALSWTQVDRDPASRRISGSGPSLYAISLGMRLCCGGTPPGRLFGSTIPTDGVGPFSTWPATLLTRAQVDGWLPLVSRQSLELNDAVRLLFKPVWRTAVVVLVDRGCYI
jgi:hypothetical protein